LFIYKQLKINILRKCFLSENIFLHSPYRVRWPKWAAKGRSREAAERTASM
jgi:hypothetical protein